MNTITDAIIDIINKQIQQQNLTQYKLAQNCNIPFSTIKSILQKRTKNIQFKTIILLANGLNIPLTEFVDSPLLKYENLILE